ncbi:MAG: hypothetical protein EA378_12125 [Phycisphaerales bacterium]|nr:MAG: hypothetical protein EA378_12125 [Phycisphaerales bacterium]
MTLLSGAGAVEPDAPSPPGQRPDQGTRANGNGNGPANGSSAAEAPAPTRADLLTRRLVETYRRLVRRTPSDARTDLLAELLEDTEPELRRLGFELVQIELAEARRPGPAVLEAARKMLADADPVLRARAASLLNQIADPTVAPAVLVALERETDPHAANELLRAVARWPKPEAVGPVLDWMEREPRVRASATETAWSLERAQVLGSADRARVLAALRSAPTQELTVPAVRFLSRYGTPADRAVLAALLTGSSASTRVAAAEALAPSPVHVDVLLSAADTDPAISPYAAEAIARHRPDAVSYARVRTLGYLTNADRVQALARVASALSPSEVLVATNALERLAATAPDTNGLHDETDALLAALITMPLPDAPALDPDQARVREEGLVRLASWRLDAARPDAALQALQAIAPVEPGAASSGRTERAERLRVIALIWSNRLALAEEADAPATTWLTGLERAIREPHAGEVVERIRNRFDSLLTPTERERLEALAARAPSAREENDGGESPGAPPGMAEPGTPPEPVAEPTGWPASGPV